MEKFPSYIVNENFDRRERLLALAATFHGTCCPIGPIETAYYNQRTTAIEDLDPIIAYVEFKTLAKVVECDLRMKGALTDNRREVNYLCFPDCLIKDQKIVVPAVQTDREIVSKVVAFHTTQNIFMDDRYFRPQPRTRFVPSLDFTHMLTAIKKLEFCTYETVSSYYDDKAQQSMAGAVLSLERIKEKIKATSHREVDLFSPLESAASVSEILPRMVSFCTPDCTVTHMREVEHTMTMDRTSVLGFSADISGIGQYRPVLCEAIDISNLMYHLKYERVVIPTHKMLLHSILVNSNISVETAYGVDRLFLSDMVPCRTLWWGFELGQYRNMPDVAIQEGFNMHRDDSCKYYPSCDIFAGFHVRLVASNSTEYSSYSLLDLAGRQHYLYQLYLRSYCATRSMFDYDPLLSYFVRPVVLSYLVEPHYESKGPRSDHFALCLSSLPSADFASAQVLCQTRRRIRFSHDFVGDMPFRDP